MAERTFTGIDGITSEEFFEKSSVHTQLKPGNGRPIAGVRLLGAVRNRMIESSRGRVLVGLVVAAGTLSACEPDYRPNAPVTEEGSLLPDAGFLGELEADPVGTVSSNSFVRENGESCVDDGVCESGACRDGFCCASECDGVCTSCGVEGFEGICVPSPGDPVCPELSCPEPKECLGYDDSQTANNCLPSGECRTSIICAELPLPVGTTCGEGGVGACDGEGVCQVEDKASLTESCVVDDDCAEGHCVEAPSGENFCCDSACDGVCEQCGFSGRCDSIPDEDSRCGAIECPDDNVCRNYPDSLSAGQCLGLGQCAGSAECLTDFVPTRPENQCSCDDSTGNCAVLVGVSCERDGDCGDTAACEDTSSGTSVCCATACGGSLFCRQDGSECVECEGSGVTCQGSDEQRCEDGRLVSQACANGCTSGAGCNNAAPVGFSCAQSACVAGAVCQADTTGVQRCCARDCAADDRVCGTNGSCECRPGDVSVGGACLLQNGEPCTANSECTGDRCVDNVCAQEACDGFCERVEQVSGACVAIPAGQQDNSCNNTHECTGARGDCRARTGESCLEDEDSECVSNTCEGTAGNGATICCAERCGAGLFCSSDGLGCLECTEDEHCEGTCNVQSGRCVEPVAVSAGDVCGPELPCGGLACLPTALLGSVCCAQNCGGQTPFCSANGLSCVECASDSQCLNGCNLQTGRCNEVLPLGQICLDDSSCTSGACVDDSQGVSVCCAQSCGTSAPFCRRDGQSCIECDSDEQCANGTLGCDLDSQSCRPLRDIGAGCFGADECGSGFCESFSFSVSRCCAQECGGDAAFCSRNGTQCVAEPQSGP